MFAFNLVGNLTRNAEARQVGERYAIGMSVAINRRSKDGNNIVTYINVVYWCKSDKVTQYLTKGKKVAINGSWYDNKEGKDGRWYQTFYANEIEFGFDSKQGGEQSQPQQDSGYGNIPDGDDDLPF